MSEDGSHGDVGGAGIDEALAPTIRKAIEVSIRLGAITLLVVACLMIVAPFLTIVAWALIIAIAADGGFETLSRWLGGRRVLAAILAVTLTLILLIVPTVQLSTSLVSGAQKFAQDLNDGSIHVPPPDPSVAEWPIIGKRVYENWRLASVNLADAMTHVEPQLQAVSRGLLKAAGSVGAGILQMVGSLLIAGFMLVRGRERRQSIERFAARMAGPSRGPRLAELANATVRSVVQGILGVALVQALLAGGGFILAGIPAAGFWALLVLVAAVVQLPVALVMVPPVLYAFSSIGGVTAIVLMIWCVMIGLLDNVLKPILFGRGVEVPSLVIFLGAIGGMLTLGIIGLFLGSVVLALGFALFLAWLSDPDEATDSPKEQAVGSG
jgi:predicted PurR-regulated permease PerM